MYIIWLLDNSKEADRNSCMPEDDLTILEPNSGSLETKTNT